MRRILVTFLLLILNLVFQSTLLQGLQIRGIIPNTAIVIIVSYALLRGSVEGAIVGLCSGLLQDIFFGNSIGYYALLGMVTGYLCGRAHQEFYRDNYFLPLVLCTAATFLYETTIYFISFLFRGDIHFLYYLLNTILPETVYTAIISAFIYKLLFWINEKLEQKEKHKRRLF